MKILFISNAYVERTLLDYFMLKNNHQIILLKANHPDYQHLQTDTLIFMSLEDALKSCDIIYLFPEGKIPPRTVQRCKTYAKTENVRLFYPEDTTPYENNLKSYLFDVVLPQTKEQPNVLVLQIGESSQIERAELNLCRSLKAYGVRYTLHTNSWLDKVKNMAILLGLPDTYEENKKSQLIINTIKINILDLITNDLETLYFDKFMRSVKTDYIIMCCENDYSLQNKLNDIFLLKFSRPIDKFVKSEYVSLSSNNQIETSLFIEHVEMKSLFDDIKMKLTYPSGVKEFHFDM